ncbi:hypothetical protein [Eubacterium callanderi]|uniref:hypothetical protein n=1 Tax=Eubacterium callanderi TaxID=53442 RepID=UPI00130540E2|nr:hypothetical protein [Eubacterium callanderi]
MISVEEKLGVFTQYLLRKQREWGKQTINTAKDKKLEMVKASGEKNQGRKTQYRRTRLPRYFP